MSQNHDPRWRVIITLPEEAQNPLEHAWPDPIGGRDEDAAVMFARRRLEASQRHNRLPPELKGHPIEKLGLRVEAW